MPVTISSRNHRVVKSLLRLKRRTFRDREGLFIVEGVRILKEAVESGAHLIELFYVEEMSEEAKLLRGGTSGETREYVVVPGLLGSMTDVVTSQGILGVVEQVDTDGDELLKAEPTFLLVADQVRDPGNLGSLIRLADAAGMDGLVATVGCADIYNPKVVRSAAGSHFHLPLVRGMQFSRLAGGLRSRGIRLYGLDADGEMDYLDIDYRAPTALVVGNEAFGIHGVRGMIDGTVRVEMPGRAESLNVACAAAAVVFEALRQRRTPTGS